MTLDRSVDRLPVDMLDTITLAAGVHDDRSNGLCSLEVVAWLAGEPHSDRPACACPVIGAFVRTWNDTIRDEATRTRLLRPLLLSLVGSRSSEAVERQRAYLAVDWLARIYVPAFLDRRADLTAHAVALRALAPLTDAQTCRAARTTLATAAAQVLAAPTPVFAFASTSDAAEVGGVEWQATRALGRAAAAAGGLVWSGGVLNQAGLDAADIASAVIEASWGLAWAAGRDLSARGRQPTVDQLQISAADLVESMVAIS